MGLGPGVSLVPGFYLFAASPTRTLSGHGGEQTTALHGKKKPLQTETHITGSLSLLWSLVLGTNVEEERLPRRGSAPQPFLLHPSPRASFPRMLFQFRASFSKDAAAALLQLRSGNPAAKLAGHPRGHGRSKLALAHPSATSTAGCWLPPYLVLREPWLRVSPSPRSSSSLW